MGRLPRCGSADEVPLGTRAGLSFCRELSEAEGMAPRAPGAEGSMEDER